jgi:hypothetical protein
MRKMSGHTYMQMLHVKLFNWMVVSNTGGKYLEIVVRQIYDFDCVDFG